MDLEIAGIGRRFSAMLIDGLFFTAWVFLGVLAEIISIGSDPNAAAIRLAVFGFGWTLATEGILVGMLGATPGKLILGIRIVRTDGSALGFGRAFGRWFGRVPSSILLIGYFMALFDQRRRAMHDRIADTIVVRRRRDTLPLMTTATEVSRASARSWLTMLPLVGVLAVVSAVFAAYLLTHVLPKPGSLSSGFLRLGTLGVLQGAIAGLARRNTRMLIFGAAVGCVANAIVWPVVRALVRLPSELSSQMASLVTILPDIAIAAALGFALRSRRLAQWGAAMACLAFLRTPIVAWSSTFHVTDPAKEHSPFVMSLAFNVPDMLLFWCVVVVGIWAGYRYFPERLESPGTSGSTVR
jgi:uncharacterized RDD family membrane protein YckC